MSKSLTRFNRLASICFAVVFLSAELPLSAATISVPVTHSLNTSPNSRNFLPTGKFALYSKIPGTKGAKITASKQSLASLKVAQDQGQTYFYGQRAAQFDNRWYLQVTTFDHQHRGWIYVGTTNPVPDPTQVTGGLKYVQTFKTVDLPPQLATETVYFSTPTASTLTETAPDWTQYHVGRNRYATSDHYLDPLTITQIGYKQNGRDHNAKYDKVVDQRNPAVSGWVKASSIQSSPAPALALPFSTN